MATAIIDNNDDPTTASILTEADYSTDRSSVLQHVEVLLREHLVRGYLLLEKSCPACTTPLVVYDTTTTTATAAAKATTPQQWPIPNIAFCVRCNAHVIRRASEVEDIDRYCSEQADTDTDTEQHQRGSILVSVSAAANESNDSTPTSSPQSGGEDPKTGPRDPPGMVSDCSKMTTNEEERVVPVIDYRTTAMRTPASFDITAAPAPEPTTASTKSPASPNSVQKSNLFTQKFPQWRSKPPPATATESPSSSTMQATTTTPAASTLWQTQQAQVEQVVANYHHHFFGSAAIPTEHPDGGEEGRDPFHNSMLATTSHTTNTTTDGDTTTMSGGDGAGVDDTTTSRRTIDGSTTLMDTTTTTLQTDDAAQRYTFRPPTIATQHKRRKRPTAQEIIVQDKNSILQSEDEEDTCEDAAAAAAADTKYHGEPCYDANDQDPQPDCLPSVLSQEESIVDEAIPKKEFRHPKSRSVNDNDGPALPPYSERRELAVELLSNMLVHGYIMQEEQCDHCSMPLVGKGENGGVAAVVEPCCVCKELRQREADAIRRQAERMQLTTLAQQAAAAEQEDRSSSVETDAALQRDRLPTSTDDISAVGSTENLPTYESLPTNSKLETPTRRHGELAGKTEHPTIEANTATKTAAAAVGSKQQPNSSNDPVFIPARCVTPVESVSYTDTTPVVEGKDIIAASTMIDLPFPRHIRSASHSDLDKVALRAHLSSMLQLDTVAPSSKPIGVDTSVGSKTKERSRKVKSVASRGRSVQQRSMTPPLPRTEGIVQQPQIFAEHADFETNRKLVRKEITARMRKGWRLLDRTCSTCVMPMMADPYKTKQLCVLCRVEAPFVEKLKRNSQRSSSAPRRITSEHAAKRLTTATTTARDRRAGSVPKQRNEQVSQKLSHLQLLSRDSKGISSRARVDASGQSTESRMRSSSLPRDRRQAQNSGINAGVNSTRDISRNEQAPHAHPSRSYSAPRVRASPTQFKSVFDSGAASSENRATRRQRSFKDLRAPERLELNRIQHRNDGRSLFPTMSRSDLDRSSSRDESREPQYHLRSPNLCLFSSETQRGFQVPDSPRSRFDKVDPVGKQPDNIIRLYNLEAGPAGETGRHDPPESMHRYTETSFRRPLSPGGRRSISGYSGYESNHADDASRHEPPEVIVVDDEDIYSRHPPNHLPKANKKHSREPSRADPYASGEIKLPDVQHNRRISTPMAHTNLRRAPSPGLSIMSAPHLRLSTSSRASNTKHPLQSAASAARESPMDRLRGPRAPSPGLSLALLPSTVSSVYSRSTQRKQEHQQYDDDHDHDRHYQPMISPERNGTWGPPRRSYNKPYIQSHKPFSRSSSFRPISSSRRTAVSSQEDVIDVEPLRTWQVGNTNVIVVDEGLKSESRKDYEDNLDALLTRIERTKSQLEVSSLNSRGNDSNFRELVDNLARTAQQMREIERS